MLLTRELMILSFALATAVALYLFAFRDLAAAGPITGTGAISGSSLSTAAAPSAAG